MKDIIVFEPPETLVVTLQGVLDADNVRGMFKKWETFVNPSKKAKVLVDFTTLEEIPPKTREALKEGGRKFQMSKVASFGASTKLRMLAGLVLKMIPQVDKSGFFKTEEEARAWLAEGE